VFGWHIEFALEIAVRPLILVLCIVAALTALPWLADNFREPQQKSANASVEVQAPTASKGRHTDAAGEPVGVQAPSAVGKITEAPAGGSAAPTPLPAAKPEVKRIAARQGATFDLQATQDQLNGMVPPAVPAVPAGEGVLSDGYLPPWEALRGRGTQLAQSSQAEGSTGLTERVAARSLRISSRRRATRHASARRRSRSIFANSGFSFFGF
jgi:hypothetical protein